MTPGLRARATSRGRTGFVSNWQTFPRSARPRRRRVSAIAVRGVYKAYGDRPVLAFRIGRFAYLTDCNQVPESTLAALDGLDVLVLDALRHRAHPTHFSLQQAVAVARRIGARRTWFTHMCHDLGHAATNAVLPETMALAYDGLRVSCR